MPEFSTTYRGRDVYVELDKDGMVLDIYPVNNKDKIVITESNKIAFEVDHHERILDVMAEYQREMAEHKKARGRDRCEE